MRVRMWLGCRRPAEQSVDRVGVAVSAAEGAQRAGAKYYIALSVKQLMSTIEHGIFETMPHCNRRKQPQLYHRKVTATRSVERQRQRPCKPKTLASSPFFQKHQAWLLR